jgi:hypothetical protein
MKTISNREFAGNLDHYFDVAREQDEVRVKKGREMYRLVCEASIPQQPIREPDDDYRRAITIDELKERMSVSIHKFFADKQ